MAARLIAIAVVLCLAACATGRGPAELRIDNVTIYSGAGGGPFVGSVAVRDGKIAAVTRGTAAGDARAIVDGTGAFLTPGLWDMHTHVRAAKDRAMDVAVFPKNGVTSIRDLGGFPDDIAALQAAIAAGAPGPTLYPALSTLNGKPFAPFHRVVTTEAEAQAAIDDLAAHDAVQIKVHRALPPELLPIVIRLAHAKGLAVTGHIPLGVAPLAACEAGMDGIEHIGSFLESYISVTPGATADDAISYMLSDASAPLCACLRERGVYVTPTLVVYPAVARGRGKDGKMPAGAAEFIDKMGQITARLHSSGVTLLSGTDTSDLEPLAIAPGTSLLDELEMLQQAGIAPPAILTIATLNGARAVGPEARSGSIEVGKDADFLLLSADPGRDVRNLRRSIAVYRAGRRIAD